MKQRQNLQTIRTELKLSLQFKQPIIANSQEKMMNASEMNNLFTNETSKNVKNIPLEFDQKFIVGDQVGSGAHAIVCKCYSKESPKTIYAVKIFRTSEPEIINIIKMTFNLNKSLRHKNIAQVHELFINELTGNSQLVMEYFPYNSLEHHLRRKHKFFDTQVQKLFKNLVKAVCHVHSKGIAHRDLKPDNILINLMNMEIKLIDFGVSKRFLLKEGQSPRDMWTRTGNIFYQAPEIFDGVGYDDKVDIWSLGVILYQIVCGKLPFHCDTIMDTIEQIQLAQPQVEQLHSPVLQDLLLRLLKKEPTKRLNINDILTHPWFQIRGDQHIRDDVSIKSLEQHVFNLDVTKSLNPDLISFSKDSSQKQSLEVIDSDDEKNAAVNKTNWTLFKGINSIQVISVHKRMRAGTAHNIQTKDTFSNQ